MNKSKIGMHGLLIAASVAALLPMQTTLKIGITSTLPIFIKCLSHDFEAMMINGRIDSTAWSVEYIGMALPMLGDVALITFNLIELAPSALLFAAWVYAKNEN